MKKKQALSIIIAFAILCSVIFTDASVSHAATQNDAVNWAVAQIGKSLDYDGVYGAQCVDLIKYYYNYFGVAGYAKGNANEYAANALPSGWTRVYGGYQPGDIGVWKVNYGGTGAYGHVGIITSADSVGFNAVNQNYAGASYCTQNWFNLSVLSCAIRPAYSNPPAPSEPRVSFSDFSQNAVWDTNAEMYIKIMNPDKAHVTAAGCYLYDNSGNLLKSYSESCSYTTSYVNYNCNINNDMKYTLEAGTTYKFQLYGVVNGKEYRDIVRSFTTTGSSDKVAPVITDISIFEVTEDGYKVKCRASDNVGVVKVQFPTWTTANGQDDIQEDWGNNSKAKGQLDDSGYFVYEVKRSDHNNEFGDYLTHIYAFDEAGNSANAAAPIVTLIKDSGTGIEEPVKTPGVSEKLADGNALASVAEKEYALYKGQNYNSIYGSSPWCCNFVSWCAREAGIAPSVIPSNATVQVMYNSLIDQCKATVVTVPQRGDIVFYKYSDYDPENYHHIGIMVSEKESVQGNVNNTWWKGSPDALNKVLKMTFVRPAYNGEYVEPSQAYFCDYNINKAEDTNLEVYIKIQNPNREGVTEMGCSLYDMEDHLLKTYSESCNWSTSYVNYTCNFNTDMGYELSPGTKYKIVLYAVVGGKKQKMLSEQFRQQE